MKLRHDWKNGIGYVTRKEKAAYRATIAALRRRIGLWPIAGARRAYFSPLRRAVPTARGWKIARAEIPTPKKIGDCKKGLTKNIKGIKGHVLFDKFEQ